MRQKMKPDRIAALLAQFEAIAKTAQGIEFWFARELQPPRSGGPP
jgi:hypothetical protein